MPQEPPLLPVPDAYTLVRTWDFARMTGERQAAREALGELRRMAESPVHSRRTARAPAKGRPSVAQVAQERAGGREERLTVRVRWGRYGQAEEV
jgi:hypothetical protein